MSICSEAIDGSLMSENSFVLIICYLEDFKDGTLDGFSIRRGDVPDVCSSDGEDNFTWIVKSKAVVVLTHFNASHHKVLGCGNSTFSLVLVWMPFFFPTEPWSKIVCMVWSCIIQTHVINKCLLCSLPLVLLVYHVLDWFVDLLTDMFACIYLSCSGVCVYMYIVIPGILWMRSGGVMGSKLWTVIAMSNVVDVCHFEDVLHVQTMTGRLQIEEQRQIMGTACLSSSSPPRQRINMNTGELYSSFQHILCTSLFMHFTRHGLWLPTRTRHYTVHRNRLTRWCRNIEFFPMCQHIDTHKLATLQPGLQELIFDLVPVKHWHCLHLHAQWFSIPKSRTSLCNPSSLFGREPLIECELTLHLEKPLKHTILLSWNAINTS